MEEEARKILRHVVGEAKPTHDLAAAIHARVAPLGGVDLDLPQREAMREPPAFDRACHMIILDTIVDFELLRPAPKPRVEQWLSAQDGLNVYLTSISEAELRFGLAIMGNGKRPGALVDAVDRILREDLAGRILPFDSDAAQSCATIADLCDPGKMHEGLRAARRHSDEVLESVYIGRRFRNDIERLEKRFEMYPWMTTKDSA